MNVTFKSAQTLGNRPFKAGTQVIGDHLSGNQKFKALVKSGQIIVHPRDPGQQKVQAAKDALARKKAEAQRQASKQAGLVPLAKITAPIADDIVAE